MDDPIFSKSLRNRSIASLKSKWSRLKQKFKNVSGELIEEKEGSFSFTAEQSRILIQAHGIYGEDWESILSDPKFKSFFDSKSAVAIRNHFYYLVHETTNATSVELNL